MRHTASKAVLVALALLSACSVEPGSTAVSEGSSDIGAGAQAGSETPLASGNTVSGVSTVPGVGAETPEHSPAAAGAQSARERRLRIFSNKWFGGEASFVSELSRMRAAGAEEVMRLTSRSRVWISGAMGQVYHLVR